MYCPSILRISAVSAPLGPAKFPLVPVVPLLSLLSLFRCIWAVRSLIATPLSYLPFTLFFCPAFLLLSFTSGVFLFTLGV